LFGIALAHRSVSEDSLMVRRKQATIRLRNITMTWGLGSLFIISLALNVVQANKLGGLNGTSHRSMIGSPAEPFAVTALDGQPKMIRFDGPTILYYFSPQCGWCEKNWLNIKALTAGTASRYRFIGLSTTSRIVEFLENHQLTFEVYSGVSPETLRKYDFGGTPRTVVVGADGRIAYTWAGAYTGNQQAEIEHRLAVSLPGLVAPPNSR
jgi:peroxiredoxin